MTSRMHSFLRTLACTTLGAALALMLDVLVASAQQQAQPRVIPYRHGQPIPEGYSLDDSIYRGPVIAGAVMVGPLYVIGLSTAASFNFANQGWWLALPVAGPWVTLATRHRTCTGFYGPDCYPLAAAALFLDGLVQTAGAMLFIVGVSSHHERLVRTQKFYVTLTPTRVGSGYGLAIAGRL